MSVTDVPEEILATKAGGGGASPLPRLRAFLGSHLLGVQARSGSPVRDVPQPMSGGAMAVDAKPSCGTDFPHSASCSVRACAEILEEVRLPVTDTLMDGDIGNAYDVKVGQLGGPTDRGVLKSDVASGPVSVGPRVLDLRVPGDRSSGSVSGLDASMSDVSNSTDHQSVSHTSQHHFKQDQNKQDQLSRLAEQAVPAGPDQQWSVLSGRPMAPYPTPYW